MKSTKEKETTTKRTPAPTSGVAMFDGYSMHVFPYRRCLLAQSIDRAQQSQVKAKSSFLHTDAEGLRSVP